MGCFVLVCAGSTATTLFSSSSSNAQTPILLESQKLLPDTATDYFGSSVALSGDVAVIGAVSTQGPGSAYIYRYDGTRWIEEQKLLASDGTWGNYFGFSVSVSGNVAVIGVPLDAKIGNWSGSAYVYRYDGTHWVEEQKLLASDGGARGSRFGWAVSISGNVAVIGGTASDVDSASTYVYRYDGTRWVEEQKLEGDFSLRHPSRQSVSISGNVALMGDYEYDDNGFGSLSAYVYRYDGTHWVREQKLLASDGGAWGSRFGWAVSVSGDVAVIGGRTSVVDSTSTYLYRYDGIQWVEEQKLVHRGASSSVSVSGDVAVIGAGFDDDNGNHSGSTYVYRYTGTRWVEVHKLLASDGAAWDLLGYSVSVSGDMALLSAREPVWGASYGGSAYTYDLPKIAVVDVVIKPSSDSNPIKPSARGKLPVAILGSDTFDVTDVDVATLAFGPDTAAPSHDLTKLGAFADHLQDVDDDGVTDLISHYRIENTGIEPDNTEACITGNTLDGTPFKGCDVIRTVQGKPSLQR
jgi:hypothetical protein